MTKDVVWHDHQVTRMNREKLLHQKGLLLWFTGLSGSGKSTIANTLAETLHAEGKLCYVLDGDNIRHGLNKDLGFSSSDRVENIRRIGEVAKLFVDCGVIVMTAFISPFRADRDAVRSLVGDDFIEVFVDCSLSVCELRDPKGLYKKARAGEIKDFTGIHQTYEAPHSPEITVDSSKLSIQECVQAIYQKIFN
jgi:adenylylsulfate kinase